MSTASAVAPEPAVIDAQKLSRSADALLADAEVLLDAGCYMIALQDPLAEVERAVDQVRLRAVRAMRSDDRSWEFVAEVLGITGQAAHQRYAHQITGVATMPESVCWLRRPARPTA